MADFEKAIQVILKHEGGWVDHPSDPGGETQMGISMKFIQDEGLTPQDLGITSFHPGCLKNVTLDTVKKIYKKCWWDRYGYGDINDQNVSIKTFDMAVNMGPAQAHKIVQNAVNLAALTSLKVDGKLGVKSKEAINNCDPNKLLDQMCALQLKFYQNLVIAKPSLSVFIKNWTKRSQWRG